MYTSFDFQSKKQLKEAIAQGKKVTYYQPGLGDTPSNGVIYLEGPHYPKPHKWYAKAFVENGVIVKAV